MKFWGELYLTNMKSIYAHVLLSLIISFLITSLLFVPPVNAQNEMVKTDSMFYYQENINVNSIIPLITSKYSLEPMLTSIVTATSPLVALNAFSLIGNLQRGNFDNILRGFEPLKRGLTELFDLRNLPTSDRNVCYALVALLVIWLIISIASFFPLGSQLLIAIKGFGNKLSNLTGYSLIYGMTIVNLARFVSAMAATEALKIPLPVSVFMASTEVGSAPALLNIVAPVFVFVFSFFAMIGNSFTFFVVKTVRRFAEILMDNFPGTKIPTAIAKASLTIGLLLISMNNKLIAFILGLLIMFISYLLFKKAYITIVY